ncbi:PIG-L family deacetylase [bacterium]|nr:PIG-L family deacetylase [bacterium]
MSVLVIAPHADDEVLGCGGLIARRAREGHEVDLVIATIGERCSPPGVPGDVRRRELHDAAEILGAREPSILYEGYDAKLDTLPRRHLVMGIEAALDRTRYDEVFFSYPSHHQDHRAIYEAAFAALRERGKPGPGLVALYEYPYVGWAPSDIRGGRFYVDIAEVLPQKERALAAYRSRRCAPGHPTAWESVHALARMRGVECGRRFAELFYVLKMVE